MSAHRGLMKARSQLHNTILARKLTTGQKNAIASHPAALSVGDVRYSVGLDQLPPSFDPYDPDVMRANDPADIPRWFNKTDNGDLSSVLSIPSDQAGCGSCWAFAGAAMFTSRIRAAMLRKYGQQACLLSSFFQPIDYCTGETGIEPNDDGGVVNVTPTAVVGYQTRNRISPYYTATFAPKLREDCGADSPYASCIQHECRTALLSPGASSTKVSADLHMTLGSLYPLCLGCDGNHIAMPMILYTGASAAVTKGAATIAEYNLFNWACMFGNLEQQKKFCPGGANKTALRLFAADRYMYVTADDLQNGARPSSGGAMGGGPPIETMEELIMCELYNYGPVSIGFDVYDSFQQWGNETTPAVPAWTNDPPIYTAADFINDIQNPATSAANKDSQGGHAVVIYGWGEKTMADGTAVKFWRAQNSWGRNWGNLGHFHIERGIDGALANAGLPQRTNFENEMAVVYFSPDPSAALYNGQVNDLSSMFHKPAYTDCPHADVSDAKRAKVTAQCVDNGGVAQQVGINTVSVAASKSHTVWAIIIIVVIMLAIGLALYLRRRKHSSMMFPMVATVPQPVQGTASV